MRHPLAIISYLLFIILFGMLLLPTTTLLTSTKYLLFLVALYFLFQNAVGRKTASIVKTYGFLFLGATVAFLIYSAWYSGALFFNLTLYFFAAAVLGLAISASTAQKRLLPSPRPVAKKVIKRPAKKTVKRSTKKAAKKSTKKAAKKSSKKPKKKTTKKSTKKTSKKSSKKSSKKASKKKTSKRSSKKSSKKAAKRSTKKSSKKVAKRTKSEDLTKIEGIGPAIRRYLSRNGVKTYKKLAGMKVGEIRKLLAKGGEKYKLHNPRTWPQQARLAAKGEWTKLGKLQERLDGGQKK